MISETSFHVVVLAVDVGRDRPADRHITRTRGDRHEEATGNDQAHQFVEAHAGSDGHRVACLVEHGLRRTVGQRQHSTTRVLSGIAITAPESTHQNATAG